MIKQVIILIFLMLLCSGLRAELFESFEGISHFYPKTTGSSTLICDGMPMPGWKKIQPPHYDTYGRNEGGGYGWEACYSGRTPMCGWMSGTHSTPPTEGAGNVSAYITYTLGGSKYNDSILATPKLEGHNSSSQISFWYKSSFTNFADSLYCLISTNETIDSLEDFTIEAWRKDMPRGNMTNDFGDPWQKVTINVADYVPVGTPFYVGFREYYWNNWYDVRMIELDVIKVTDVYAEPIINLKDVYTEGPEVHVDYNIFGGTPTGDVYIVWGSSPNPVRYGDWNSQKIEQGNSTCTLKNFPAGSKMYVRAQVAHQQGNYYSDEEFIVYAGDADGEGYLFESFEDITNFYPKTTGSSTIICDGIPMAGWKKIQPPHYDTYGSNQGGGYGWEACYAGRTPMCGWMTGTHSTPPTEGSGNVSAYTTYTLGGSKYNDSILVTPVLENIKADYQFSFWYKSSFTNFADSLSCIVSTDPEADTLEDFTIEAWRKDMPRGDMDGDFGDPWQKVTLDIGSLVPEGSDIRIGLREYYWNNWYDVRVIEMDVLSSENNRPRSCLQFDGADDYIKLNVTNEPSAYTIEAWVCPQATGAQNLIVRTPGDPLSGYSRQLRINSSGQFEHYLYDGAAKTVTSTTQLIAGNWYHVAGTAENSGEIKLYVNGKEEGSALSVGTITSHGTNVLAGCATGGSFGYFNGKMDEIRFWDKVLTGDEICDTISTYTRGIEDNLEACYHLDSTFGQDLVDSHSNGENGYWFGAMTDSYVARKLQPYYNGVDDYTFITNATRNANYTLEAWVYPKKEGAQTIMVLSDGDTTYSYMRHLRINSDNKFEFYNYDGTERTMSGIKNITLNTWHHVAVTAQNGGNMKLYVNGTLEAEASAGNTMWGSGYIGYYMGKIAANDTYGWFNGWIKNPKETSGVKTGIQLLNEIGEVTAFVVPYSSWPTWVNSSAPIGDSTSAIQWHPRGAWSVQQNSTPEAERGLNISSLIGAQTNYVVYGDNNEEGFEAVSISGVSDPIRMKRVWHVEDFGDSSKITLTFNATEATASDMCRETLAGKPSIYKLLKQDESTGDFEIYTNMASSATSTNVTFGDVSIAEGYYTLGMATIAAPMTEPASNITAYSFTANWNTNNLPDIDSYQLDVSFDSFSTYAVSNLNVGNVSSYSVTNLNPDTQYKYRVRTVSGMLISTNSATATADTLSEGYIIFGTWPLQLNTVYGATASNSFTMSNTGQTTYSTTNTTAYETGASGWLSFSPIPIELEPGGSTNVTGIAIPSTTPPGTYNATATFYADTASNSPHDFPVELTITKATAQVQLSNLSQNYDGTSKSVTATTTPSGLTVDITYNSSNTPPTEVGSYTVSVVIDDTCYEGSTNGTLIINKGTQSINSFTPNDGSSFASTNVVTLTATASTGLPVTFSIVSGNAELFNGNELRFTGGGSALVQASQAGNDSYNPTYQINTYSVTDNTPTHYVALNGQTAYPPYASWETAATNIQDAVNLAIDDDTVLVDDGVYNQGTTSLASGAQCRIIADKTITIASVNGYESTIIAGGGSSNGVNAVRGAYIGSGCTISGFTFTNGHTLTTGDAWTDQCGGGLFLNTTGIVENCYFAGNSASAYGGGVYLYNGGLVKQSILSGNTSSGGGGISFYYNGQIENSLIINNSSSGEGGGSFAWWGGKIVNCTISENTAPGIGDGAMFYQGGSLYNSIAYGNGDSEVYFKEYTPIEANNYTSDPHFANSVNGDYRPAWDSPCIGGGTNLWTDNDVDLDYSPRTINENVDIGCYQTPQSAGNALDASEISYKLHAPDDFDFSGDFTIELWVKTAVNGMFFSKRPTTGEWATGGKQFGIYNNLLMLDVCNIGSYTGGDAINDSKWHHVAVTCKTNPREIMLLVDGSIIATETPASWTGEINPATVFLGEPACELDELRFWTTCRSQQQIQDSMFRSISPAESNLLWYSRANQLSDSNLIDLTSNGHVGIPYGTTSNTWVKSNVPIGSSEMAQNPEIAAYWDGINNTSWYTNGLTIELISPSEESFVITGLQPSTGTTTDSLDGTAGTRMVRTWDIETNGTSLYNIEFNMTNASANLSLLNPANYVLLKKGETFFTALDSADERNDYIVDINSQTLTSGEYTLGTTPGIMSLSPSELSLTYRRGTPSPTPQTFTLSNTGGTTYEFSSQKNYYPTGTDWLDVSPTTGILAPESSIVVTAALTTVSIPAGQYCATNTFNATGLSKSLEFMLTVLKQQFTITSSTGEHGTISPLGETIVEENDNLTFTITPSSWYSVSNIWINSSSIGSTEATYTWTNILANGSIYATFKAICITNDHIDPVPEYWLAKYNLTNNMEAAVELDQDNDGAETWQEYIAGTIPTNPGSVFMVLTPEPISGTNYTDYVHNLATNPPPDLWRTNRVYETIGYTLSWPSFTGRVYDVMYGTNLQGTWFYLNGASNLPATPPTNVITNPVNDIKKYYKINVRMP